ncbi:hypothetical protein [Paraburkholderia megapolitana]|uniref:Uncharacterized protein n=1 Tax=Paraburkholderia megapolitana TaxID=420953 RepID=A0A1I3VL15_9BURK|nr:hypothetical protein [Paraburkholderia megapolitana]QDQ84758.1 hypothetical protein FNZ07_27240 [Paraburkholderia megapolitana]SFJ95862.1 hypothetical protein SAMN05192543_11412 [Paraburkholderia megapolitana]
MARTKETRANAAPGAGTLFALRAIGLVILARWLFSMAQMDIFAALSGMASSPWACINLVFLFLLIFLPGARAQAERPFHPLPQWLRQALRFFALLGFVFALWSIGAFVLTAGWRRTLNTVAATNGWLVAAPALYAAVLWICRPRPLWRTNIAARRFAIGRYAVALDVVTRTVIVWAESRKLGQYDARELSVRWLAGVTGGVSAGNAGVAGSAAAPADAAVSSEPSTPIEADAPTPAAALRHAAPVTPARSGAARWGRRPKIELLWNSPAAAGHNRQRVFRTPLATEGDRTAARALDTTLSQTV